MLKTPIKWLFALGIPFSGGLSLAQTPGDYQLLWEITGRKLQEPSYLFGSMHSNDPRLFQFPDSLYIAFEKAEAVVLETDVSGLFDEYDVRLDLFNLEILDKNRPYTNSREATRTVYGSEDGRPQFLDAYFQQTGFCGGKAFFPLEGLDDQLKAIEQISTVQNRPSLTNLLYSKEAFVQSYIQGDIAALSKMLKSQLEGMKGAYETLITKRNIIMATGLDTLMRKQSVFCAIGSGHLYGPEGVIQLLRAKGYNVRCVNATYAEEPPAAKTIVNSWRTYTVTNNYFDFSIKLSGKPVEFADKTDYRYIFQELGQGNTFELIIHPTDENIKFYRNEMIDNQRIKPTEFLVDNKWKAVEGMCNDDWKGLQWKRVIIRENRTYILVCYGGNKFMHSDRPKKYFDKLVLGDF